MLASIARRLVFCAVPPASRFACAARRPSFVEIAFKPDRLNFVSRPARYLLIPKNKRIDKRTPRERQRACRRAAGRKGR
jgi:hypothetical protein